MMRTFRLLLAIAAVATLTTSCWDDDDNYSAGFTFLSPHDVFVPFYANNLVDTISFVSYGDWSITRNDASGSRWCSFDYTSGRGNTIYTFPIHFTENNSGTGRGVLLRFVDVEHPNDANAMLQFWQYATRGDGVLGGAPDVKTITGSDGSRAEFSYDVLHRPVLLNVVKDNKLVQSLTLQYDDVNSEMTVRDMGTMLSATYSNDYQPMRLVGASDTVGYYSQYSSVGLPVAANYAFNVEHRHSNGENTYYAYKLGGESLSPDSLHCADSLRVAVTIAERTQITKMKLHYSNLDNRCQSVDVNQLVFGLGQCDPYQLLSLFRYARNTSIISEVTTDNEADRITVDASLNSDRSVARLTVTRHSEQITYDLEY